MSATITPRQLLDRLHWRYATKQFDPKRKISAVDWAALEEALLLSPSSGGLQPWMFIVVDDSATRARLLPASFNQAQVMDASHLVVFAAKTNFSLGDVDSHIAHTAEVRGVSVDSLAPFRNMLARAIVEGMDPATRQAWAGRQVTIALGNLLTCAAMIGIDACPMEGFLPLQYDAILGLKVLGLASVAVCTLGYRAATDAYAALPKVRYPKQRVVLHI